MEAVEEMEELEGHKVVEGMEAVEELEAVAEETTTNRRLLDVLNVHLLEYGR